MEKRKLKVYQTYSNTYKLIPEIRLKGQWLQAVGFSIGANITVQYLENQIIIKKEN